MPSNDDDLHTTGERLQEMLPASDDAHFPVLLTLTTRRGVVFQEAWLPSDEHNWSAWRAALIQAATGMINEMLIHQQGITPYEIQELDELEQGYLESLYDATVEKILPLRGVTLLTPPPEIDEALLKLLADADEDEAAS